MATTLRANSKSSLAISVFAFLVASNLVACSVYRSAGRKNFESKALDNVNTNAGSGLYRSCWVEQLKDSEVFWHPQSKEHKKYSFEILSDDLGRTGPNTEVLVCTEETTS